MEDRGMEVTGEQSVYLPSEEDHDAVSTACQGRLIAIDVANDAEHTNCIVRIGVRGEGMEMGGEDPGC
jgi:hypothetical protein